MSAELSYFLSQGSAEWDRAWKLLRDWCKQRFGKADVIMENPHNGEVWQYMGTYKHQGEYRHEFRHRSVLLAGNDRIVLHFPASGF